MGSICPNRVCFREQDNLPHIKETHIPFKVLGLKKEELTRNSPTIISTIFCGK